MPDTAPKLVNNTDSCTLALDDLDRDIVLETQGGLPLVSRPYHVIAERLNVSAELVQIRIRKMIKYGIIRRIALVPNHYHIGYQSNGMSVWDVEDSELTRLGMEVGSLDFVSHAYERPRYRPTWPYNLFAMVHGRSQPEVLQKVDEISAILGEHCRSRDILFSSRILKKSGMRLSAKSVRNSTGTIQGE